MSYGFKVVKNAAGEVVIDSAWGDFPPYGVLVTGHTGGVNQPSSISVSLLDESGALTLNGAGQGIIPIPEPAPVPAAAVDEVQPVDPAADGSPQ